MSYNDKFDTMRDELADKAVGEIVGVAKDFAEQLNQHYRRVITTWSMSSHIDGMHDGYTFGNYHMLKPKRVSVDVGALWWSDAVELAWEIEGIWNRFFDLLDDDPLYVWAEEHADYDTFAKVDEFRDHIYKKVIGIIEDRIEDYILGTEDLIWQLDDDELEEEHGMAVAA